MLTFEFENIPRQTVQWAAEHCEVRPRGGILHLTQNRAREKEFLAAGGFPLQVWANVATAADLVAADSEAADSVAAVQDSAAADLSAAVQDLVGEWNSIAARFAVDLGAADLEVALDSVVAGSVVVDSSIVLVATDSAADSAMAHQEVVGSWVLVVLSMLVDLAGSAVGSAAADLAAAGSAAAGQGVVAGGVTCKRVRG